MQFNSYEFLFGFLPATVAGFWLLARFSGHTAAMGWLILASVGFYAYASVTSLAIIAPSIVLDYLVARTILCMDPSREPLRKVAFVIGVAANILFLGYFKYKNFFQDTANTVLATHFKLTQLILPLGISFITFQKIAFLADVQSGQVKVVRFFDFLLFTLFFPRTIAGPIVHYDEVMPQLADTTPRSFMTNDRRGGLPILDRHRRQRRAIRAAHI
jgi:alginate O-acetyltransferase complex protein AlgI